MLNLYHGLWADYEGLIIAVAQAEDHILIRVIRSGHPPQYPRPVFFRAEHDMNDLEGATTVARQEAAKILEHEVPADLNWREYSDLGLLIRLL